MIKAGFVPPYFLMKYFIFIYILFLFFCANKKEFYYFQKSKEHIQDNQLFLYKKNFLYTYQENENEFWKIKTKDVYPDNSILIQKNGKLVIISTDDFPIKIKDHYTVFSVSLKNRIYKRVIREELKNGIRIQEVEYLFEDWNSGKRKKFKSIEREKFE